MRNLLAYNLFENERPVVSFDFDGVLHKGVYPGTIHPILDPSYWVPFVKMHEKLREEAKTAKIIVISARNDDQDIKDYIKRYNLPVEQVIITNNMNKLPFLKRVNAIRHYDDNKQMVNQLHGSGIEFVLVDPGDESEKVYEDTAGVPKETGKGSLLLIKGAKLPNGKQRLYFNYIKKVLVFDRLNKHDEKKEPVRMVILGNDFYLMRMEGEKLKPIKIAPTSEANLLKAMGLQGKKIALNDNKTPLHYDTLKYTWVGKMIAEMGQSIKNLKDIEW